MLDKLNIINIKNSLVIEYLFVFICIYLFYLLTTNNPFYLS